MIVDVGLVKDIKVQTGDDGKKARSNEVVKSRVKGQDKLKASTACGR